MFPPCLCVFRCGTTPWLRQPRTGLMPACGSTGHLTSSGSSVKTSPSGQDGEWPLTPPPPPQHLLLLSGMTRSQQSWSLPCSPLLLSPKGFCTVTRWLLEECSCDPSNKQKLCFQPWPMRTKAHPFSGSWLSIWKHRAPSRVATLFLLRSNTRLKGIQLILTVPCDSQREFIGRLFSKKILDLSSNTNLLTYAYINNAKTVLRFI